MSNSLSNSISFYYHLEQNKLEVNKMSRMRHCQGMWPHVLTRLGTQLAVPAGAPVRAIVQHAIGCRRCEL